jgi:hypothetical protein
VINHALVRIGSSLEYSLAHDRITVKEFNECLTILEPLNKQATEASAEPPMYTVIKGGHYNWEIYQRLTGGWYRVGSDMRYDWSRLSYYPFKVIYRGGEG